MKEESKNINAIVGNTTEQVSDDTLTDNDGFIQPNLYAKIMRHCMENKNILSKSGSLYVGTGETKEIEITNGTDAMKCTVYKTKAIDPPTAPGDYTLCCTVDTSGKVKLKWIAKSQEPKQ